MQLKYTEFEKLKMAKELSYVGNKEPTHPIFLETLQKLPRMGSSDRKPLSSSRSSLRSKSNLRIPTTRMKVNASTRTIRLLSSAEDSDPVPKDLRASSPDK